MMQKSHKKMERYVLFSEVAKRLSFAKAADSLSISRSYLSNQIKQLEKELGNSLLIRSTRQVRLTPAGFKVLEKMLEINSAIISLERELEQNQSEISGLLRITAPEMFSQSHLTEICHHFKQKHQDIEFDIDVSANLHDLTQSRFDLAIRSTNTPPENMVAKKLMSYQHICCASPEYLDKFGQPEHPLDLVEHHCLSNPHSKTWPFYDGKSRLDVDIQGALCANNQFLLLHAAMQGQGILKAPDYLE
ncbi:transcriptional regulator, LysR family protein, partial [Vibrio ichthyoenteri ATCC 700023]